MRFPHLLITCALLLGLATTATAADAPLTSVSVYPASVKLTTKRDRQSLIVQAIFANGLTRDVTGEAKFALADAKSVSLAGSVLTPKADGKSELTVTFGGKTVKVPVEVEKAGADRPISFRLDVMPIFMKANCNTGSCHGSARGKDGFRLSLFGYDPDGDYFRITRQMSSRRLNLALADESLMMENHEETISTLNDIRDLGVTISLDDFGTGYSSLSYLKKFPIDTLKIDQSFIRNALNDNNDASIAKTIITLGHSLNLKVIAEGVETVEHERFLLDHNCDEVQGFRYSRPVPNDQFVKFITSYSGELSSFG